MEIARCVRGDSKPIGPCKPQLWLPHNSVRVRQEVYMMTLYPFASCRGPAFMLIAAALLAACASGPGSRTHAPTQPLQRLVLPQPAADKDALTSALAAEFALS